jgi:hypothetical protein
MMVLDSGLVVSTRDGIYFIGDPYSITPEERELSFLPEGEYTKIVKQDSFFYSINMDSNQVVCFTLERLIHKWNFRDPLRYLMVQDSMMVISTDTKKIILYKLMNHVAEYVQTIELNFLKKNFYIEPIVLVNHHLFVLINEYGIISIRDFFSPEYKIQSYTRFFPKDINLHYILFKDKFDDSFWTAGFYEGLYRWTPNGKLEYITEENGLANNLVRSVLQDQFNRLWFGTQNGISVLKNKYITIFNENSGLRNEFIWGINKIGRDVFICTNSGMYILHRKRNKLMLTEPEYLSNMKKISFNYIEKTSEGIFLTTSQKYGLYELKNNHLIDRRQLLKESDSRLAIYIYEDSKHRVWLGGYDIGYIRDGKYHHLKKLPFSSDLKNRNIVYDIVESPETGIVYFASTNGLYAYQNDKISLYSVRYPLESIYSQVEYDPWTDKILIGTEGKGVLAYDEKTKTFSRSVYDTLVKGRNVYNIMHMDTLLLVTTNIGLTAISRSKQHIWHVNSTNGLLSNETNSFALSFDDQYIYLGTTDGLHVLSRHLDKFHQLPGGKLYIKEISSNGAKIDMSGNHKIVLPSSTKHLKIKVGYTSYFNYFTPRLRYTIRPYLSEPKISDAWEIEFYNLPYGANELRMEAIDPENKVISKNAIRISIEHLAPIYYSYKFYIAMVLGLVVSFLGLIKIRTHRLEQLSVKLKKEVEHQFEEITYLNELLEKIIQKSQFGMILFDSQGQLVRSNEIADFFIRLIQIHKVPVRKEDFLLKIQISQGEKIKEDFSELSITVDGKQIWHISHSFLKHQEGRYDLYLIHDITDILEKESFKKQMQAYQQIIATVSHYINNALSALQLKNEVIGNKYTSHAGLQELMKFINYTIRKITYILQTLDSRIQHEDIHTSNYANVKDLLIDIEKYVEDFDERYGWK